MRTKNIVRFGSWVSPIKADLVASGQISIGQIAIDGKQIYWNESRPYGEGRNVIATRDPGGNIVDIIPPPYNARSRVHEYGGGSFTVKDGIVYFSNFEDQRLYFRSREEKIKPLTANGTSYYADLIADTKHRRIICIREEHLTPEAEPVNSIGSISIENPTDVCTLIRGNDFYSSPRLSPDGEKLAYLTWNHPQMPWDGTELWVAAVKPDGTLGKKEKVAGGTEESIFQPEWSPDNILYFISDRNNWWNLYRFKNRTVEPLLTMEADFGVPAWVFGLSTYDFYSKDKIICSYTRNGEWYLSLLNLETKDLHPIEMPFTDIYFLKTTGENLIMNAASPREPASLLSLNLATKKIEILRSSFDIPIHSDYISIPEPISFPSGKEEAYGFYYPPKNKAFESYEGELPPLIVIVHGGPTSSASTALDLKKQFWTSRGFAVFDVNYGGSSGYGRKYRDRLKGMWGVTDVDDCINGAKYLVEKGKADRNRLIIKGGSAGGYTVLCALTFRIFFQAGASYYGVSDLVKLAEETHKFEAHYLDSLIGKYPEDIELYRKRSPVNYADKLCTPVIFFQGLEDKVVPPEQSESFVSILRKKGIPVAYIAFEKEQHGFRRAQSIKHSLEAEFYFYLRIFGFQIREKTKPIIIENLDGYKPPKQKGKNF
jgi:dipeptidyl aminopeptidase/acylaminoacyl peptidase